MFVFPTGGKDSPPPQWTHIAVVVDGTAGSTSGTEISRVAGIVIYVNGLVCGRGNARIPRVTEEDLTVTTL